MSDAWQDLTHPRHWTGGIGVPFPSKAWTFSEGELSTSTLTFRSLYSREKYSDFELAFDWKLAPGSNSGVKYLCADGMIDPDWQAGVENAPWQLGGLYLLAVLVPILAWRMLQRAWLRWMLTGLSFVTLLAALAGSYLLYQARERIGQTPPGFEYQLIDDNGYRIRLSPVQKTASLYDLIPSPETARPEVRQWHSSRIIVAGHRVEHWLDGRQILRYELGSPVLQQAVAASKFRRVAGFADKRSGYLQLQAHDGKIWFRNIKVRRIQPD